MKIPGTVATVNHVSIFSKYVDGFKAIKFDSQVFKQVSTLANPIDIAYVLGPLILAKPVLYLFDRAVLHDKGNSNFKSSLLGYLEKPIVYLTQYPLLLFAIDVISIFIHSFGIDSHIKGGFPQFATQLSSLALAGMFVTRAKDW